MKLTLVCMFLGMVVASPITNMSPNGNARIKNMDDNSYMTPSEAMISNGPTEGLPNGTHHPWHHKGKHGHGQAQHGKHHGHSEPCHEHHSPPFAPPPHWPQPHSPSHGHGSPSPHEHGHHGGPSQIRANPWADDDGSEVWEDESGFDTQDEAGAWFMGWDDEAGQ